jgi:hypothetical protein
MGMKTALSEDLRQAILQSGDAPVEVEDEQTNRTYYLVPREQYEKLKEVLGMDRVDPSLYEFTDEVLYEDS